MMTTEQDRRVAALAALDDIELAYHQSIAPADHTPSYRAAVEHLGRSIGYGNMMHIASELWREQVGPGAFTVGACYWTVGSALATIREALATPAASCDHCGSAEGSAAHFREGDWLCALATPDARVARMEAYIREQHIGRDGQSIHRLAACEWCRMCLEGDIAAALAPGEPKSCMCSNRSVADYEGPLRECPIHGEPREGE